METQTRLADARAQRMIGEEIMVIVDGWDEEADAYACRSKADAPEIDGVVFVASESELSEGDIVQVRVNSAQGHELWASF